MYLSQKPIQEIRKASEYAGLNPICIISELFAVPFIYFNTTYKGHIFIINFQENKCEFALLCFNEKNADDITVNGYDIDRNLGGINFVDKTTEFLIKELDLDDSFLHNPRKMSRLQEMVIDSIVELSVSDTSLIISEDGDFDDYELTLEHFEEINRELIDSVYNAFDRVLKQAQIKKDMIDALLINGDRYARMQFLRRKLVEYFGKEPYRGVDPEEEVTYGLAIIAKKITDNEINASILQNKCYNVNQSKDDSSLNSQNCKNEDNIYVDNEFYINKGQIGESSTSITYKVIDKRTKRKLCKKVIKYINDQTTFKDAQNALKEFEVMHQISHPCICKAIGINFSEIIEIENDDGEKEQITTIALFLEYLEYNLEDVLKMEIHNTLKTRIALDIAHAMNFLHKRGMMHRDLKIENIMLNGLFETKLVDFGLVKITESIIDDFSFEQNSLTKCVGSFEYMSPEMANGKDYDNKTDVYSFGVILHIIFAGFPPKLSLRNKMDGKEAKLSKPSNSISPFCIRLIKKCLSFNPSDRPSFEDILILMRNNSYELANDVDSYILSIRDKELELIDNGE